MGRHPTQTPVPASRVAATDSQRAGVAAVRSIASAPAPVARSSGSGADGWQQCTAVAPSCAASTDSMPRMTTCGSTARTRPKPGRRRQRPLEHGRQRRLVDLQHDLGPGHQPPHVGDVRLDAVGERRHEVGHGARVGHDPLTTVEPQRRRERPRPGDLHLERPDVAVVGLGELVEVLPVQRRRARGVEPRPVDEPPPARLQVDVAGRRAARRPAR